MKAKRRGTWESRRMEALKWDERSSEGRKSRRLPDS